MQTLLKSIESHRQCVSSRSANRKDSWYLVLWRIKEKKNTFLKLSGRLTEVDAKQSEQKVLTLKGWTGSFLSPYWAVLTKITAKDTFAWPQNVKRRKKTPLRVLSIVLLTNFNKLVSFMWIHSWKYTAHSVNLSITDWWPHTFTFVGSQDSFKNKYWTVLQVLCVTWNKLQWTNKYWNELWQLRFKGVTVSVAPLKEVLSAGVLTGMLLGDCFLIKSSNKPEIKPRGFFGWLFQTVFWPF